MKGSARNLFHSKWAPWCAQSYIREAQARGDTPMADDEGSLTTDAAHTEMKEAIAAYTPTAIKELGAIAFDHIQKCWGDRDVARKIWGEAFAEGDRVLKKAEDEAP